MKLINFQLIDILNRLNTFNNFKLPSKITFAITKNLASLQKEYNIYEQALKKVYSTYDEFFQKDEDGNPKLTKTGLPRINAEDHPAQSQEFLKEVNELLNLQVQVELYKIPESYFDYDDAGRYDILSVGDLAFLMGICGDADK